MEVSACEVENIFLWFLFSKVNNIGATFLYLVII